MYNPLPPDDHFRFLKLFPGSAHDDIVCELETRTLDEVIDRYEAISYVWGDPKTTINIKCHGIQFPVTASLAQALRTFRYQIKSRLLWADAICIDQENVEERGTQVKQMHKVYRNAKRVLAWLGPDSKGIAEDCFQLIQDTNEYLDKQLLNHANPWTLPPLPVPNPTSADETRWAKVDTLLRLTWFYRLWVLPEVAVAKECTLCWGTKSISVAQIFELAGWCLKGTNFAGFLRKIDIQLPVGRLVDMFAFVHATYQTEKSWRNTLPFIASQCTEQTSAGFIGCLVTGMELQVTDPRDRVFAFLGHPLAKNQDGRLIVKVDYTRSVADVYFDIACALLQNKTEAPWVLTVIEHSSLESFMHSSSPSWIQNWDAGASLQCHIALPQALFKAGGPRKAFKPKVHLERKLLEVVGCVFDRVTWVSELITANNVRLNPKNWDGRIHATGEPFIDLLWREVSKVASVTEDDFGLTLAMGYGSGPSVSGVTIEEHRTIFETYRRRARSALSGPGEFQPPPRANTETSHDFQLWLDYCVQMRVFVTEGGRIGLVPGVAAQVGDVCCIILGIMVPFVFKPTHTGAYKLVGESYVHNVMKGDIFERLKRGEFRRETLRIL